METQVRTPQAVFMQPQRLVVPLFQRPYVWNEENQWEPLWRDVARMAERLLVNSGARPSPHFLGAVVFQQIQNPSGSMQERTIIDGQQRLTTLQVLFDALHSQLVNFKIKSAAMRLETLIVNPEAFCAKPEDRFKVWPTNRDRPAFNEVMGADPPIDYSNLRHRSERLVEAHQFFAGRAKEWLEAEGSDRLELRASCMETAARELLQMVVIDLNADENAQEIFETLNARGAQLTAADLIKNFIFQQLLERGGDVEKSYERHWKNFETAFWETEIAFGRLRYPRSSVFLNHWLASQTGEEIVAREVFTRFKRFSLESKQDMNDLLARLDRASGVYRSFVEGSEQMNGPVDRFQLFAYRTGVLESEVVKPLILFLYNPELPKIANEQLEKALTTIESWMVRRMLVRATTKSYTQIIADLIRHLKGENRRATAGDSIESFLASQKSDGRYWPDDQELRNTLRGLPAYRRLQRGRLRMVLEAIEDHLRGWKANSVGLGGERVSRGKYAIEHIMPRKWNVNWPLPDGSRGEVERDAVIHTIGNLTLLTGRLNSKLSNGPWDGNAGKRQTLEAHDVLLLNREILKNCAEAWSDSAIRNRCDELTKLIIEIWPVPMGHRSEQSSEKVSFRHRVDLNDLLSAGDIKVGDIFTPRPKKYVDFKATLLSDGRLDIGGKIFSSPSEAGKSIRGRSTNGWYFFLVDPQSKLSLGQVRSKYLESISADDEDDVGEDDDE